MSIVETMKELLIQFLYGGVELQPYQESVIELVALTTGLICLFYLLRKLLMLIFSWVK